MAEQELEGLAENPEGQEQKKGGMMKIIILVVAVVVLGVAGFFGWQMFMGDDKEKPEAAAQGQPAASAQTTPAAGTPAKAGVMVELEPFIINLTGGGGKRLVKLTMSLDVGDEAAKAAVQKLIPRIRDALILMLTSKSYEDIADVTGKVRLKKEILSIVNRNLGGTAVVNAVFFTEFVIQ